MVLNQLCSGEIMGADGKISLNRERIAEMAASALQSQETENEEQFYSHYVDDEPLADEQDEQQLDNQGSPAPAAEPAQEVLQPSPEPETNAHNPYEQLFKESFEQNKQLMDMMMQGLHARDKRTQGSQEPYAPAQQAPQGWEPQPDHLVMQQDLSPLYDSLREVQTVTNMFVAQAQQDLEMQAQAAFQRVREQFPDAEQLINPHLFQAAINGAKQHAVQALKQGRQFKVDWYGELMNEYNRQDAPRLREAQRKAAAEAEAKAKQQAELQKVSGVPSRGARFQAASEGAQRKEDAALPWRDRLRKRVTNVVSRYKAQ